MRQALAVIIAAVLTTTLADTARACSCARNPTAERILQGATTVFTGVARQSVRGAGGHSVTTFTVVESFKGAAAGATIRVLHPSGSSASCGVRFAPGETYTLAAHRAGSAPGLTATLCSTWMFSPSVGLGTGLIRRMREIRGEQERPR